MRWFKFLYVEQANFRERLVAQWNPSICDRRIFVPILMKTEYEQIMLSLGGKHRPTSEADLWLFEVNGFVVEIQPIVEELEIGDDVTIQVVWTHPKIDRIINRMMRSEIKRRLNHRNCMCWEQFTETCSAAATRHDLLGSLVRSVLNRAENATLDEYMSPFAKDLPDGPAMPQICHLAALAWFGNFNQLMDDQGVFERGHRLKFVPLITKVVIDEALSIAFDRFEERLPSG